MRIDRGCVAGSWTPRTHALDYAASKEGSLGRAVEAQRQLLAAHGDAAVARERLATRGTEVWHVVSALHRASWHTGPMARTIATTTDVDRQQLLDFVRPRHNLVLITTRRDGGLQASPVTGGVDEQGRIVISTYPERAKTANARRDPRVSVLVLSDDFGDAWVQVDGECEVIDCPESVEPLVDYFRAVAGEHPDWDEYREAMVTQGKSLLRITPTRWSPVATGGFPARLAEAD